jgi:hypothetical protein
MTERIENIIRKILDVLYTMPGGQCNESILKSSVDLLITPNSIITEFREALAFAEKQNWVIGLRPTLGPLKWTITDMGKAEHLKTQ